MAAEAGSSKFLLITLLVAIGVLGYYYWDVSSTTSGLSGEVDRVTRQIAAANKSIADIKLELVGCKAQVNTNFIRITGVGNLRTCEPVNCEPPCEP